MTTDAPQIPEPHAEGMLDVGDGHRIHWTERGNPDGRPAVILHGGPGGGARPGHAHLFDPSAWRIVQFDQRGCGEATPHASEPTVDLSTNTTSALVGDIEQLRMHLGIDRWLVWGGSWGTTLGLTYAQAHPDSVTELLLGSVVTTTHREVEWVTRAMGRLFPDEWCRFVEFLPEDRRDGNLAVAYNELMLDPDPNVHGPAAAAWCDWEDVHVSLAYGYEPSLRYADPAFRLAFARLVTHFWGNAGFLGETELLDGAGDMTMPVYMCHGRMDVSAPADVPTALARALPNAELFIAEREGHGGPEQSAWTRSVIARLAAHPT